MNNKLLRFSLLLLPLTLSMPVACQGPPFSMTVTTPKTDYILGEPVTVTLTLRNASRTPIKFEAPNTGVPYGNMTIVASDESGQSSGLTPGQPYLTVYSEITDRQNDGTCTLAPGAIFQITCSATLDVCGRSSTWELWGKYIGRGPFEPVKLETRSGPLPYNPNCKECWKGEVESPKITIHFSDPTGSDLEPYLQVVKPQYCPQRKSGGRDWWLDESITSIYPTSLFASWVRFTNVQTGLRSRLKDAYTTYAWNVARLPYRRSAYSPQSKEELTLNEDTRPPYLIEQCRLILRNHPNLEPVASITRVDLAALLYITGDTPGAKEQLETVLKARPDSDEGKAAREMLAVISAHPNGEAPPAPSPAS